MARCEDFPCCGHEAGECPRYNTKDQRLCVDCDRPLPYSGRCLNCAKNYTRRARSYQFDGTGQDQEAYG